MNLWKTMLLCLIFAASLACGDDDSSQDVPAETGAEADADGDADADADAEGDVEDVPTDTPADTPTDTPADTPADTAGCPPDDATHIYINVSGTVQPIGTADVSGLFLAAVAPLDALTGTATPLATTTVRADGTFLFECLNVKDVAMGLVVLSDDGTPDGVAGTFFPTLSGVGAWSSDAEKVDLENRFVFGLPNAVVDALEGLTGITPDTDGMVMGLVLDESDAPLAGATVGRAGPGPAIAVDYPTPDLSSLVTPPATSASGMWVLHEPLGGLTNITATLAGHTFPTYPAATPRGYCFFVPFRAE